MSLFSKLKGISFSELLMPEPLVVNNLNQDILEFAMQFRTTELVFNRQLEQAEYDANAPLMYDQQRAIHDRVLQALNNNEGLCLYIPGSGGVGKAFLVSVILNLFRMRGHTILPTAWSGLAATLMKGGQTCCSRYALPVPFTKDSRSNIKPNTDKGNYIRRARAALIDEASQLPSFFVEELCRIFQDVSSSDQLFANKIVIITGDLKQTLPILPGATKYELIANSVTRYRHWTLFEIMPLTRNMRVNADEQWFSNWLEQVGLGLIPRYEGLPNDSIRLPQDMALPNVFDQTHNLMRPPNEEDLIKFTFGSDENEDFDTNYYSKRAILTPLNVDALAMNERIIEMVPGEKREYFGFDSIKEMTEDDADEMQNFPPELLHELTPGGMSPHRLSLKNGCRVMLQRNTNQLRGFCNGSLLRVVSMYDNLIVCQNLSNQELIMVHRMPLTSKETGFPFTLVRVQFPLRLGYCITNHY
jgi:ATP-dependent DNA helicase PIF1